MYKQILTVLTLLLLSVAVGATGLPDATKYSPASDTQTYHNMTDADIAPLADRYDRDVSGDLSIGEMQVIYRDWLKILLNTDETTTFIAVLGENPVAAPSFQTSAVTIVVDEPNYPCDYENIVDVKYGVRNPGHGDDVQYRAGWRSVRFGCDDVIGIMTHPNLRMIIFRGDRNTCWYRDTATPRIHDRGEGNQAIPYSGCDHEG